VSVGVGKGEAEGVGKSEDDDVDKAVGENESVSEKYRRGAGPFLSRDSLDWILVTW
jgi:hypothetical protein